MLKPQKIIKLFVILVSVHILGACASSGAPDFFKSAPDKDYSNMYLRGVFNWWEVNEGFKLIPVLDDQYAVTIELIADGQPYDFKVADASWTMTLNCGSQYDSKQISLNTNVNLSCNGDSLNLQFTPSETALYRFVLDTSNNRSPTLRITQLAL